MNTTDNIEWKLQKKKKIHSTLSESQHFTTEQLTHSNELIILQFDDVSHANVHPFLILQALKFRIKPRKCPWTCRI